MNNSSKANERFKQKNYDRFLLQVPKGTKEKIKKYAEAEGMSMNRYILEAISDRCGERLTLDKELPWMKRGDANEN